MKNQVFNITRYYRFTFLLITILWVGCAGLDVETEYFIHELPEPERIGVYHKVNPGETLWRIAKTYDVSINDVITANNIPNAAQVEKGQLVFIPGAYIQKQVLLDEASSKNDFIWPMKGNVIGHFHERKNGKVNKGIDIKARDGEEVVASRGGKVVLADFISGYGYTVILDHEDGYYTLYSHNGKLVVKLGASVVKNEKLAYVGRVNKETYLHFEIRNNSGEHNPLYYLP